MSVNKDIVEKSKSEDDWAATITKSLVHESDRGCILIGIALLDEALVENLRLAFRKDPTVKKKFIDPLFESSGPLNSFSHRINIAFALGTISADVRDDLHTLRKLRNETAHLYGPTSFQDQRIRSKLKSLRIAPVLTEAPRASKMQIGCVHGHSEGDKREIFVERLAFMLALSHLCGTVKAGGYIFERTLSAARFRMESLVDHVLRKKDK
jgi:DNA-binding MltR family transcriptional regulator